MSRTISVIVPVYNTAAYLEFCLKSLLEQTYTNLEVILVDDGSTDGSGKICDEAAVNDRRVRVIHQKNSGVSAARNTGLHYSTGDYITFADPDDWLVPDAYSQMVSAMEEDDVQAVFCGFWEERTAFGQENIKHANGLDGVVPGKEGLYHCINGIGRGYFNAVWNKLFVRMALFPVHDSPAKFDTTVQIGEDELFLCGVLPRLSQIRLLPRPLYYWRQHRASVMHQIEEGDKWHSALAAKKKCLPYFVEDSYNEKLFCSKVYEDLFPMVWRYYCMKKEDEQVFFETELDQFRPFFYAGRYASRLKKLRFALLSFLCRTHMPSSLVSLIGNMTREDFHLLCRKKKRKGKR